MFFLNHIRRICPDNAAALFNQVTGFLLRTLVTPPAIFGVLFLLLACNGNVGDGLLKGAEALVRDAPAGQVWTCTATDNAQDAQSAIPDAAPECHRQAVARHAWVNEANHSLASLYKTGVLLSLIASVLAWLIKKRAFVR